MFPEGTRSRDGRVGPFKAGSLMPAVQAGIPIVPLSLVGSRHVMRKGELTTRPGDVVLVVHDPVPTADIADPSPDTMRDLAARIRAIIAPAPDAEADGGETALQSRRTWGACAS